MSEVTLPELENRLEIACTALMEMGMCLNLGAELFWEIPGARVALRRYGPSAQGFRLSVETPDGIEAHFSISLQSWRKERRAAMAYLKALSEE